MTANGVVNAWTTYANELPVKQKIDDNENGTMDRILFFDGKGQLEKCSQTLLEKTGIKQSSTLSPERSTPGIRT